ncbi:MAG: EFR1 family ferrodoxin [Bacillota bacterium]|nr:EFR1 family ferrodoxin [Bacillota bacterium]
MKFSTFYFSGTGNTEWAVQQFHEILLDNGQESEVYAIENIDLQNMSVLTGIVNNSDFVGFAHPIYGGNIPPIVKSFLENLMREYKDKQNFQKPVYIINTFGYVNGFGPFCARKLFQHTVFTVVSYVNIQLCNNISTPKLKINRLSPDKLNRRKEKAKAELRKAAEKLLAQKRYITGIGPYLLPNIIVRKKSKKGIAENYKIFSVDSATCKKCMLCVNKCPTKSIVYSNGTFSFLPTCTACMRCYNNCPASSILFNGQYADPAIYERYHGPF